MRKIYSLFLLSLCSTFMLAQTNDVTFVVDMNTYSGSFTTINLNGTFNAWCGGCNPMTDANNDGVWEITLPINSPDTLEYKFTVDGWTDQENFVGGEPCTVTNGGFTNRQLIFSADTVLDTVCWNFCGPCSAAPPPPAMKNVTFNVDMREYTGAYTSVDLNGSFNGWCGSCNPMTDADGDSIWTLTLPLPDDSIEYKFTLDGWTAQENFNPGGTCTKTAGGFTNRFTHLSGDTVLGVVCWESCSPCQNVPAAYSVTFQVDMNQYTGSFTTPEVNGIFNGWCGNCTPMSDPDNDDVWTATVVMVADSMEYKFSVDNWGDQESLTPGSACTKTVGAFTNRFIQLTGDIVLPPVCWGDCATCSGTPTSGDVTFRVDMTKYTGPAYTDVHLNGTFNNWCGACAPMLDPDNDSIYELTVNVGADTIDFKFTLDGWTNQENFVGGEPCTRTDGGFTNRSFIVSGDTTLPAYCWEACSDCNSIGIEENAVENLKVFPNPASEYIIINGDFQSGIEYDLSIRNANGSMVHHTSGDYTTITERVDISDLPTGIYVMSIQSGKSIQSVKIAVLK